MTSLGPTGFLSYRLFHFADKRHNATLFQCAAFNLLFSKGNCHLSLHIILSRFVVVFLDLLKFTFVSSFKSSLLSSFFLSIHFNANIITVTLISSFKDESTYLLTLQQQQDKKHNNLSKVNTIFTKLWFRCHLSVTVFFFSCATKVQKKIMIFCGVSKIISFLS